MLLPSHFIAICHFFKQCHHKANLRDLIAVTALTLSQWSSSGNPVAIQCAWNLDPSVHWNATGEMPVCFQWSSSGLPVAFQWSSSVFQLCKLTLDRHWDTTGCKHQPVWFQWHPSVLVAPVVFQCVPIMQINTGLPLEHHWVLASASVAPVASQCTYGSSGLPVWSVQWHPSALTESGLEVIKSGHFPACDPLCIHTGMVRVVWTQPISFGLQPQIHKNYNGAHIKGMHRVMLKYSHVLRAVLASIAEQ